MFTKRTVIGLAVGSAIIGIGAAALAGSFGLQAVSGADMLEAGRSTAYTVTAPAGTEQSVSVSGDRFEMELESGAGMEIPKQAYENSHTATWLHVADGTSVLRVKNTGEGEVSVAYDFLVVTDPVLFAYHFVVITAGIVIIGFSMGFSVRKPRGF